MCSDQIYGWLKIKNVWLMWTYTVLVWTKTKNSWWHIVWSLDTKFSPNRLLCFGYETSDIVSNAWQITTNLLLLFAGLDEFERVFILFNYWSIYLRCHVVKTEYILWKELQIPKICSLQPCSYNQMAVETRCLKVSY